MGFETLWKYSRGESQIIAFIDSGISPELEKEYGNRIVYKYNAVENTNNVYDVNNHGTRMVSIACNDGNHDVFGIAPQSKIIVIKVIDNQGKTKSEYLSKAIKKAVDYNATIINLSIGGHKNDSKIENAVNYALENGVTVVAAAGDYGQKDLLYPAKYDGTISVQGLDIEYNLWIDSNREDCAVNTFPCQDIETVDIDASGNLFKTKTTGTSQATALASGYIALIKDYHLKKNGNNISNKQLLDIIKNINTFDATSNEYTKLFGF